MPFYEVVGSDLHTRKRRTLHVSARNDEEAVYTAADQGITEIKLRPFDDREMLLMDLKCFLYADPLAPVKARQQRIQSALPRSALLDRPWLTITGAVLLALTLDRLLGFLITRL